MKTIRHFAVFFTGILLLSALTSCGKATSQKEFKIGISIPSADHGWTGGVVSWAEQAKKDIEKTYPDVHVVITSAAGSTEQVNNIENLLAQGIDALVVLPHVPEPLTAVCEKAKRMGVKLVVVDRGLKKPIHDLEVAGDNRGFGMACAEAIAKELGGKGKIIVMEGIPCQVNTDRLAGFEDVMKQYPGIQILQKATSNWSQDEGFKLMENMLAKYPQIDAVWAGDDDVLRGALTAYKKSKRADLKLMLGGGGSKFAVKKVMDKDPLVRLTVTYPPKMIHTAAMEAVKLLKGRRIVIPADTVNAGNASKFYYPDSLY